MAPPCGCNTHRIGLAKGWVNFLWRSWVNYTLASINGKELCDLLVVFDEIAIIWQVKDLKLDKHGNVNSREVEKNVKQLAGARRQLFELKTPIELYNPRRRKETFDPASINEVHLISALMGEEGDVMNMAEMSKNQFAHVFTKSFLPVLLVQVQATFCARWSTS